MLTKAIILGEIIERLISREVFYIKQSDTKKNRKIQWELAGQFKKLKRKKVREELT